MLPCKAAPVVSNMKTRNEIGSFLNRLGLTGVGVELGVLFGEFSRIILRRWKGEKLVLVDPLERQRPAEYVDGTNESNFDEARYYVGDLLSHESRAWWMPYYSDQAVHKFSDGSLDFVYIDANHSYKHVAQDLRLWAPKVKAGGMVAGHDYYNRHQTHPDGSPVFICGVKSAVDEWAKKNNITINVTAEENPTWWYIKT